MIRSVKIDYNFDIFLSADYTQHEGSCIKHQVHELTDIHEKFGGFPKSYCFENTKINQLWWTPEQVDYNNIGQQLNMEVITISSILQPPGCVIPLHRDTFYQIKQQYPNKEETKVRANIYLENYHVGQFLQYLVNDHAEISTDWQAGDGFMWDSDVLHLSSNAGMQNKYTLQVSGFLL